LGGISIMKKIFIGLILSIIINSSQVHAVDVQLQWDANTDPAVAGYKIYYGLASRTYGTPIDAGNVTEIKLTGLPDGKTTYFAATAYDKDGNESAFSTELVAYTIVPSVLGPGTISPSVTTMVSSVTPLTYTITPAAGGILSDVLVDEISVGKTISYPFTNVSGNHTIKAVFVKQLPMIKGLKLKP
jgi:hypothetical protein